VNAEETVFVAERDMEKAKPALLLGVELAGDWCTQHVLSLSRNAGTD